MDGTTARMMGKLYRCLVDMDKAENRETMFRSLFAGDGVGFARMMSKLAAAGGERQPHVSRIVDLMDASEVGRMGNDAQGMFWIGYYKGWRSMSAKEAASRLGCTIQNIYKLIDNGKLDADKGTSGYVIWEHSVEKRLGRGGDDASQPPLT